MDTNGNPGVDLLRRSDTGAAQDLNANRERPTVDILESTMAGENRKSVLQGDFHDSSSTLDTNRNYTRRDSVFSRLMTLLTFDEDVEPVEDANERSFLINVSHHENDVYNEINKHTGSDLLRSISEASDETLSSPDGMRRTPKLKDAFKQFDFAIDTEYQTEGACQSAAVTDDKNAKDVCKNESKASIDSEPTTDKFASNASVDMDRRITGDSDQNKDTAFQEHSGSAEDSEEEIGPEEAMRLRRARMGRRDSVAIAGREGSMTIAGRRDSIYEPNYLACCRRASLAVFRFVLSQQALSCIISLTHDLFTGFT